MGFQPRHGYPSKAAIDRTVTSMVAAAEKAGIDVGAIEVSPDGRIRIVDTRAVASAPASEFDRWESQL
ncbi:hypothetical protein [Sphingobium yanoikuyae]|jgi:hypothetical protein|uniref:Uncharacterized protein n=1 Tax=Sphingobium yanoikuyae TaxID=13690 RepID=A0A430BZC3_SPHYA|nr:hypothetical protein [Sphingobium yanoikuyae]RSU58054.1 hypothetical protein DAH51_07365 [Sphingobium yanoikuyae]